MHVKNNMKEAQEEKLFTNKNQQTWQAMQEKTKKNASNNNMLPQLSDSEELSETESTNGMQGICLSTPEENTQSPLHSEFAAASFTDRGSPFKRIKDIECESVSSDYSEVAGPLKDLADNEVEIFGKEDLQKASNYILSSISKEPVEQHPDETDEEFNKRVKKINFLSLAQEFAELKKINADALPFDLHVSYLSDGSLTSEENSLTESAMTTPVEPHNEFVPLDTYDEIKDENSNNVEIYETSEKKTVCHVSDDLFKSTNIDKDQEFNTTKHIPSNQLGSVEDRPRNMQDNIYKSTRHSPRRGKKSKSSDDKYKGDSNTNQGCERHDFDVYNIESTLPQMDWETLELQLKLAAEEEKQRQTHRNDREEIRRKLAMGTDEEYYYGERAYKKPNLQTRLQSGMNLQICFMNEVTSEQEAEESSKTPRIGLQRALSELKQIQPPVKESNESLNHSGKQRMLAGDKEDSDEEDFFKKQAKLQKEAKLALAQASTMAHMQLEVEKQMKKKSPIAEMVGIPGFGDGRKTKLSRKVLQDMNVAQLQVIVNDLLTQITSLNEDLVEMLLDRDDLHMEQDSMLVDIEDLTRRAQDYAKKINSKQKKKK